MLSIDILHSIFQQTKKFADENGIITGCVAQYELDKLYMFGRWVDDYDTIIVYVKKPFINRTHGANKQYIDLTTVYIASINIYEHNQADLPRIMYERLTAAVAAAHF